MAAFRYLQKALYSFFLKTSYIERDHYFSNMRQTLPGWYHLGFRFNKIKIDKLIFGRFNRR